MLTQFQQFIDNAIKEHNIPGASVAVWKNQQLVQAASGILNLDTGVNATCDSVFQIGSITKVMTTCLVMKLVEQQRIALDQPVKRYLRDFALADQQASGSITVKQLLNHTNGIAGDYFPDDLNEDGPHIARYVYRCSQLPLVHPVGDGYSYSNAAFAIAGRLVEVMGGISWFDAIEEWIFQPLGMNNAICRPADVIRFRAALGHLSGVEDTEQLRTCSGKYLCMGQSPAGTTLTMTIADLITFGRAFLNQGVADSGVRWLSADSVQLMQRATADIPASSHAMSNAMGLGWMLGHHNGNGLHFLHHSGATNGQCAHLRIFPDHDAAVAVLMNRCKPQALLAVVDQLSEMATDVAFAMDEVKPDYAITPAELKRYCGRYQSYAGEFTIEVEGKHLTSRFVDAVDEEEPSVVQLVPVDEFCFEQRSAGGEFAGLLHFSGADSQGVPQRLSGFGRLFQRAR